MVLDSSAPSFSPVMKWELRRMEIIVFASATVYLLADLGQRKKEKNTTVSVVEGNRQFMAFLLV